MDRPDRDTEQEPDPPGQITQEMAEMRRERDAAIEAFEESEARARRLGDELQHRVRNMLSVIRSIQRRTLEASPSPEEFIQHFEGRLEAIGRYQTRGVVGQRRRIELEDIIRDELLPTRCLDTPACVITGPTVLLEEEAVGPLTLAIHELAINSFKFGALRPDSGRLEVSWSIGQGTTGPVLHFRWEERAADEGAGLPSASGFGRQYIEDALPYQTGATTSFDLRPTGLVCTITLPLRDQPQERELLPIP